MSDALVEFRGKGEGIGGTLNAPMASNLMYSFVSGFLDQYGDMEGGYPRSGFLLPELRNEPAIHSAGLTNDLFGA